MSIFTLGARMVSCFTASSDSVTIMPISSAIVGYCHLLPRNSNDIVTFTSSSAIVKIYFTISSKCSPKPETTSTTVVIPHKVSIILKSIRVYPRFKGEICIQIPYRRTYIYAVIIACPPVNTNTHTRWTCYTISWVINNSSVLTFSRTIFEVTSTSC